MPRIYTELEEAELDSLALDTWGMESQLDMVVEECAELIFAIQKSRRKAHKGNSSIIEEMGDVQNCLNQFKLIWPEIEQGRHEKLARMEKLLKAGVSCQ